MKWKKPKMQLVLPAQAGVILSKVIFDFHSSCTPRASGGDPLAVRGTRFHGEYSPRKRG